MSNGGRHWQTLTRTGYKGGGKRTLATLTADASRPILLIGRLLIDRGFNVNLEYVLMFDSEHMAIGLKPSKKKGELAYKAAAKFNRNGNPSHSISAVQFCKTFGLRDRYTADECFRERDVWVLPLRKINV